ncbi:MAG: universal stress protein [Melioribacteraceae bacterium]|jgi:universal stress protein A|nr:universal stress protein [Melioribacteraceae bacterium]
MFNIKNIIVPTDLSKVSLSAFNYAKSIAIQWNAKIHILSVIDPQPAILTLQSNEQSEQDYLSGLKTKIEEELNEIKTELINSDDLDIESVIKIGKDYEEIVKYSSEISADLIVIATHGRTGVLHTLLGSVAEKVIRYAKCPVLVTTPTEDDL